MATDLSKVVGYEVPTQPVSWNKRDLLIYAAGVGAKADDLNVVYELDKSFAAIPTYPVVLSFKGDSQELNHFASRMGKPPPGMPPVDLDKMLHGSQSIQILKDPPTGQWPGVDVDDQTLETGIILTAENLLLDPEKVVYAKLYSSFFYIGAKATGEKFSHVVAGPPQAKPIPEDRKADWSVQDQTSAEQAMVFRLSGDYNPLHIDPAIGKAAGFGGTILHGLSTFGFGARALIKAIGGGDPRSLKFFGVRFTSPVKPGDALETEAWEVGPGPEGTIEVAFVTKDLTSNKIVLGSGIAYIAKALQASL
ncbi:peroxisomal dehydratase [Mycena olivaceomarginata]|nr:peroxisomal dehydratase [Mycena olivaceomarginata]